MALAHDRTPRPGNYVIVTVGLGLICGGLTAIVVLTMRAAGAVGDPELRKSLMRLGWLSLALLGLAVVLLVWIVIRRIRLHLAHRPSQRASRYVNAWELAGKRIQVEEDEDDDEEDDRQAWA